MKEHIMHFDKTILTWDEAIPLGNGAIGCLVWGRSNELKLSLDRCDLWDTSNAPKIGGEYTYSNLVRLAKEGNEKEIERIFDTPYSMPNPTKLPAGRIVIDLGVDSNVESTLDIDNAEALINANNVTLKGFVDANKEVGCIFINKNCSYTIQNPEFGVIGDADVKDPRFLTEQELRSAQVGNMKNLHYTSPVKIDTVYGDFEYKYYVQKVSESMSYGIFLMIKRENTGDYLTFTVQKSDNFDNLVYKATIILNSALKDGYDDRYKNHKKWWNDYFSKSYVKLDDEFFEYNWYLSNYFLGSVSRKGYYPMALQGVWTADNGKLPPWKGDYHHNLNTQLSYLSYMKANHLPEGECFVDYLLSLENKAEAFAHDFYDVNEGLCLPSVMDIEGNALGGWPMYAMNPSNIAWLCDCIADLYDYTKDAKLLDKKIYPYLKKFGLFLNHLLISNGEGKLVLPFSSSPEAHDNTCRSFLTPNSSYDLALIRNLYEDLIRFADLTDNHEDLIMWENTYNRLDVMHLDEKDGIMLSRDEKLFESHHMLSHMMAIHPLRQLNFENDSDKKIIDDTVRFLESFGYYLYVGYTFAQRGEMYAIQRQGNKAYDMLKLFWEDFCLPNGFHCNGDYKKKHGMFFTYRPFTLEGNMCAMDVLQEMLLQDHHGKLIISPAVPDTFLDYSFKLRSKCGVIIEAKIKDRELYQVTLNAYADCDFPIFYKDIHISEVKLTKGQIKTINM